MLLDRTKSSPAPSERPLGELDEYDPPLFSWGHDEHVHDFHQLLYAPVGHAVLHADGRVIHVTGGVAAWIPAGVWHSARFDEDCLVVPVAIGLDQVPSHDVGELREVAVPAVLRRQILAHARSEYPEPSAILVAAILEDRLTLPLPDPRSRAPRAVAAALLTCPDDPRTAEQWAADLYTSDTSLRRAFLSETGLTFTQWRTRARLNLSLELLADDVSVSATAHRVGFTSTNGFILAFRKQFGRTPGAFFADRSA